MNKVNLMGRIANELDIQSNGQLDILRFNLAVKRDKKNQSGEYDTDFINCTAFGNTAKFIKEHFKKGERILLSGALRVSNYTDKQNIKRTSTTVYIDGCEFIEYKEAKSEVKKTETTDNTHIFEEFNEEVQLSADDLPF